MIKIFIYRFVAEAKDENLHNNLNPKTPIALKITDKVVFRRFRGEGVEFFKSDLTDPPSEFFCASFVKYRLKPFQISFLSGFYIKVMFWVRWFFAEVRVKREMQIWIFQDTVKRSIRIIFRKPKFGFWPWYIHKCHSIISVRRLNEDSCVIIFQKLWESCFF